MLITRRRGTENSYGLMAEAIEEIGSMASSMAKELTYVVQDKRSMVNG